MRIDLDPLPLGRSLFLPRGDYVLAFRHHDGRTRFVRFTVRPGEETLVTATE